VSIIIDANPALKDHPKRKYYEQDSWMRFFVFFVIIDVIVNTSRVLVFAASGNSKLVDFLIPNRAFWAWIPFSQFLALTLFILYALLIENGILQKLKLKIWQGRIRVTTVLCIFLGSCLIPVTLGYVLSLLLLRILLCLYPTLLSLVFVLGTARKKG
jgi:hypothetical protein